MPRKPIDESNSPRRGRARTSVGRSPGRDRPDRGSSADRGRSSERSGSPRGGRRFDRAERSGSPRGGQRFDRAEGASRRGGTDRGRYSNSRTPGDRPSGDRPSRRPGRTGPSDRTGPYEGRSAGGRSAGARRSDRSQSPEWTRRRGASDDAGRTERRPVGDRKSVPDRDSRFSGPDRARPPRRGPGETDGGRAFNDENRTPRRAPRAGSESPYTRDARAPREGGEGHAPRARFSEAGESRSPRRAPREGGEGRTPRPRFSEAGESRWPHRGPREGSEGRAPRGRLRETGEAHPPQSGGVEQDTPLETGGEGRDTAASVWASAPSRRRARPDTQRSRGAKEGRPRREKREGAYGSRAPRRDRPQESAQPEGEELETTPASWSGTPPTQPEGEAPETAQADHAAPDQEHDRGEQPVRSRARHERGEAGERLQKVLSRAGVGSRREVEEWIRAGRITVNGEPAVLGVRVGPSDHVRLDGRLIRQRETGGAARVFLIHRSPGENLQQPVETSEQSDESAEAIEEEGLEDTRGSSAHSSATPLLDRMPRRAGRRFIPVSPMPRVDGGLELVTSDGDLASKLQRSMRRLSSEFSVRVHGELSPQGIETIARGELDNGQKLTIERCDAAGGEGTNRWYSLVARGASGKEVRQLFERQGALVSRVLRTQLGSLALDRLLSRGQFRELTAEELEALLAAAEGGTD